MKWDPNGSSGLEVRAGQRKRPGLSIPQESVPTMFKIVTDQTENITIMNGITLMEDTEVLTEEDVGRPNVNYEQ